MVNSEKNFFLKLGLLLPDTVEELRVFDNNEIGSEIDEEVIDPARILKKINESSKNSSFFRRTVLAAKIIDYSFNDKYLGRLKLQKLIYLINEILDLKLSVNYSQQEYGPYDPRLMRSLESQMKKKKWFYFAEDKFPKYARLEGGDSYNDWFFRFFENEKGRIEEIIDFYSNFKSHQIELVATIFACCKRIENTSESLTKENIKYHFYNWSESKSNFSQEQVESAIEWMTRKNIIIISE